MVSRLEAVADDAAAVGEVGVEIATELAQRLLAEGAPGLHFYTMNMAGPSSTIWQRLGL